MTIGTRDRLVVLLLLAAVDDDDDDKRNDEDGKDNVVVALNDDRLVVVDGINATDNAAAGNRIARKIMNKLHLRLLFSPRRGEARFLAGNAASTKTLLQRFCSSTHCDNNIVVCQQQPTTFCASSTLVNHITLK